jgi:hypothetical protein
MDNVGGVRTEALAALDGQLELNDTGSPSVSMMDGNTCLERTTA